MRYTRREDDKICAELLKLERELSRRPGSWPLADEHGEVPHTPSIGPKRHYVTPCGHKIQADEREAELNQLHETNVQIYHASAKVSREARDLRRALRRAESETVTACLAGLALLVITILGMRL
jgi:hypothetical protein